ncbi:MAG TPA: tripartite tricarboxylate transporter permease [Dongiaceae bacterium]|nr:tripartite tricarboxylate transporter permease [Dongiaceae bacterium]
MSFSEILWSAGSIFVEPSLFEAMLIGLVMGMVFGATPGLGGKMGILLLMPLLFGMDPAFGVVLLLSMHSVVHTGGSVPSILIGVPGGAPEAATVLDGFTMAKKGQAAEALGASMAASGIGGAVGALVYFLLLPVFQHFGHIFGAPEYLLLAVIGLSAVSTLSHGSPIKGFAMGALGLLASAVGLDSATGTPRFVFGRLELWDGLDTLILVTAFFAVPELLDLARKKRMLPDSTAAAAACTYGALFRGMAALWRYRWLTLRTTIIGIVIGMMPGLGAEVASWLAYGHAVQSADDKSRFGNGAIEGVIAPETANNSKEGGSLLPTVCFGIPGSSTMALMMAGLAILGLPVGPNLVTQHLDFVLLMGWSVFWSNLLAVVSFLAILPIVGKIVYLRIDYIAPLVTTIAVIGTMMEQSGWVPMLVLFVAALLASLLVNGNWPRAPFILGFIMGHLAEASLIKTTALYDWSALLRPGVLVLLAFLAIIVVRGLRKPGGMFQGLETRADRLLCAGLFACFAAAAIVSLGFPFEARLLPLSAGIAGAAATGLLLLARLRAAAVPNPLEPPREFVHWRLIVNFAALLALLPLLGALPAGAVYAGTHALVELRASIWRAAILAGGVALALWLLFGVWLRLPLTGALL